MAEAVDAADVGSRKASKVLSAFTAITGKDMVTKKRVQNALDKSRKEKIAGVGRAAASCVAVFCDGRDDTTRKGKVHNISVNMHPGDVYVGHFTCEGKHTGTEVARRLLDFLEERGIDVSRVAVVGGDGTNQVTGWQGGWMAVVEKTLGRPLGRVVCLLHQAELAYRALFCHLDGVTAGPTAWTGPIGKAIRSEVHLLPVAQFAVVPCEDFPAVPAHVQFSSDFQLLYECARAAISGDAGAVACKKHGKMHQARWHTAQSRLVRYYMSVPSPPAPLVTLVTYVICVYVPCVVNIRCHSDMVDAPRHLAEQTRRQQQYLSGSDLKVAQDSVGRNSFMAHPENLLLAMLGDQDQTTRAEAVSLIKQMRQRRSQPAPVRCFRKPVLNFGARHYIELAEVREAAAAGDVEPPYCQLLDDGQLEACLTTPLVTGIPNNTQSTERAVRLTTEAAAAVSGAARQDGLSLNKRAFRRRCAGQVTRATFSEMSK